MLETCHTRISISGYSAFCIYTIQGIMIVLLFVMSTSHSCIQVHVRKSRQRLEMHKRRHEEPKPPQYHPILLAL